jgi:hypothetical protein
VAEPSIWRVHRCLSPLVVVYDYHGVREQRINGKKGVASVRLLSRADIFRTDADLAMVGEMTVRDASSRDVVEAQSH